MEPPVGRMGTADEEGFGLDGGAVVADGLDAEAAATEAGGWTDATGARSEGCHAVFDMP
jgi:hypothetical protein